MRLQYGTSSYERARGDLPALPVVNMFAEEAPTEESGLVLQSRSGLVDRNANMGSDIEALFKADGVLGGALFGVSSGRLWENITDRGVITGSGPVSMAGNEIGLMVTAGQDLHFWNGSVLTPVAFPDDAAVAKVMAGGGRFWAIRKDTGQIYWTPPLSSTVDPLDFATAESFPDRLLDMLWIDDTAVLFGAESVEFWPNTGDADLPIAPLEGRVFEKGIRSTGCATIFDGSFTWVTNDNTVCVNGQTPTPISNPGLNARIEASEICRLFTFLIDGQEFLALRLDNETQVFGSQNRMWSEFKSWGFDNWLPQCCAGGVFGSSEDGRTFEWSSSHADALHLITRTNLLPWSEAIDNAAWTKAGASIVANAATGPTGTAVLDKIVESNTTGVHRVARSITLEVGKRYTFSAYVRAAERSIVRMEFNRGTNTAAVHFNLSSQSVTFNQSARAENVLLEPVIGQPGLFRCSYSVVATGTGGVVYLYGLPASLSGGGNSWAGDGVSGIYAGCLQLEVGFEPTQYIATGAAATSVTETEYGVLERRFRAGVPLNSGGVTINNLQLRTNVGQTPYLTGDYDDPVVEVRLSRDAGRTWGAWKAKALGEQGKYRTKVQWRALGMASQPALFVEFRVTAPIDFRISDVLINENYGGR